MVFEEWNGLDREWTRLLPTTAMPLIEQEVGVEALDFGTRQSLISNSSSTAAGTAGGGGGGGAAAGKRYRKGKVTASTSGVTLPGHHSDRKELLGRIGCDKTSS